jgi:predicted secreted protein
MAVLHGKAGNVKNGANAIAEIDNWTLDVSRDTHETTKFAAGSLPWKTFVAGLTGASAKFSGRLDMTDTNGQLALWNSLVTDTALTMSLYLDATKYFAISAIVEKFSGKVPIGDVETVDWEVKITGAVTYT